MKSILSRRVAKIAALLMVPVGLAWHMAAQRSWLPVVRRTTLKSIQEAHFSPDGRRLLVQGFSTSGDRRVLSALKLDASTMQPVSPPLTYPVTTGEHTAFFAPDRRTVAQISFDERPSQEEQGPAFSHLKVREARSRRLLWTRKAKVALWGFSLSPQGHWLLFKDGEEFGLVALNTWRMTPVQGLELGSEAVFAQPFAEDEHTFITGDLDGRVHLWDTITGRLLRTFAPAPARPASQEAQTEEAALSANGTLLAVSYEAPTLAIWDTATGRLRHLLRGEKSRVSALAFSPDGSCLAAGGQGTLTLWDTRSGTILRTMSLPELPENPLASVTPTSLLNLAPVSTITRLVWSPDGNLLVAVSRDSILVRWRIK